MVANYKIRMITAHLDCSQIDDVADTISEYSTKLSESEDEIFSELGVEVWSKRIVLDNCANRIHELISGAPYDNVLVSAGEVPLEKADSDLLYELTDSGLYAYLSLNNNSWSQARRISKMIHELAEKDPSLATHIGINVLGEKIPTPYFPLASTTIHESISIGLLYPRALQDAFRAQGYEGLVSKVIEAGSQALEAIEIASKITGLTSLGVDLSPSPWMEESTLGLVEYISGVRLPEPGIALGIALVNKAVNEAGHSLRIVTGFNEVQLPVAEDLKLKARVSELETNARDLARLSGVCLAGVDLVVVPADIDGVAGLLLEVRGYSISKKKTLGVRIIPVDDVEVGDKVYLEKFGETPVIPI